MEFKRESVFISGIRSLTKVVASFIGLIIGILLLTLTFSQIAPPYTMPKFNISVAPNAQGILSMGNEKSPVILKINIEGVIGSSKLNASSIEKLLSGARSNPSIRDRLKGILLYMNTPGGLASDSEEIYTMLMEFKKEFEIPIYAYVNGLCASGGMYIASSADKIFANNSSVVGSVGVLMGPMFNFSKTLEKFGVESKTVTMGKDKDAYNPFRPWEPDEGQDIDAIAKDFYMTFVTVVSQSRPKLTKDLLINQYGAQVYSAREGKELGYIDADNSSYKEALTELLQTAQINLERNYQVLEVHSSASFLSDYFEQTFGFVPKMFKGKLLGEIEMKHNLSDRYLYLYNG